jgi:YjjG family noncanonical pyrimidine nucleotidase
MKHITDIFFDLDHTLWDFDKNSELAFGKIFEFNFPNINIQEFSRVYPPINQACWKLYQNDQITSDELRYQRLKQSFDALNYEVSDNQINEIAIQYIELLPQNNHLFDGAIEILEYLKPNYNLHIITNGFDKVQYLKIENSGIAPYFSTITNSEMAGVKKPNPKIYEFALSLSKAKKETSIMIGDSIEADVLGALDFGIQAIYFNPNQEVIIQDFLQINHLSELKNHF